MTKKPKHTEGALKFPKKLWDKIHSDLVHWQRELRLDDVDIELSVLGKNEEEEDVIGVMNAHPECHLFIISFRHPDHLPKTWKSRILSSDYETVLTHELLHIRDDRWDTKKFQRLIEEDGFRQAHETGLDAVAEALVRARRGIRR